MLVNTAHCFDGAAAIKIPWQCNSTDNIKIVYVTHSHLGKKFPDVKLPGRPPKSLQYDKF